MTSQVLSEMTSGALWSPSKPRLDMHLESRIFRNGGLFVAAIQAARKYPLIAEESDEQLEAFRKAAATNACTFIRSYI